MKKLIILSAIFLIAVSCSTKSVIDSDTGNNLYNLSSNGVFSLITLEHDGEKHEYIRFSFGDQGSVTHWESCKYCKEKKHNEYSK